MWLLLAQQWITTKINIEKGTSSPSHLSSTIVNVGNLISLHCNQPIPNNNTVTKYYLDSLTRYNNGYQGPSACSPYTPRVSPPACTCQQLFEGDNLVTIYFRSKAEESLCLTYPLNYNLSVSTVLSYPDANWYLISSNGISFNTKDDTDTTDEDTEEDYEIENINQITSRGGDTVLLVANGYRFVHFRVSLLQTDNENKETGGVSSFSIIVPSLLMIILLAVGLLLLVIIIIAAAIVCYRKKQEQVQAEQKV
eukprot:TRINITY_DN1271_c0_g2_i7.p1 TRINITY_DN1271_c0_g2~~TRINITY_DN1271_c0_g2_i7.p1  ORF type:complete len:252 (+),score=56.71 TRINITY_DN1271_c0_g2_i7:962-1717(+)